MNFHVMGAVWFVCAAIVFSSTGLPESALAESVAPSGPADIGAALWASDDVECRNCHGAQGEGGFGPPLAGRALTPQNIAQAVRHPVGIMPAFTEKQIGDADIAAMSAFLALPSAAPASGKWRIEIPEGAPPGQAALISLGCGQCHGADLRAPRAGLGSGDSSFAWFKHMVYRHTEAFPQAEKLRGGEPRKLLVMGNYSPERLPEAQLREIYDWALAEGLRVPLRAFAAATGADGAVVYTITVHNRGIEGKGLDAKNIVIELQLAEDATLIRSDGAAYQGTRAGKDGKIASWSIPLMRAGDRQVLTIATKVSAAPKGAPQGSVQWQGAKGEKDRGILRRPFQVPSKRL